MKNMIKVKADTVVVSGIADRGCEKPKMEYNSLTTSPTNIEKAILKPIENKKVLRKLTSLRLKILRRTKPGTNDK
jgi:hypothetical protein